MAVNNSTLSDDYNEFNDWVELFNTSKDTLSINNWFISDDIDNPQKFRITSETNTELSIPPSQYLILWLDGTPTQGPLHIDFKLSSNGETLLLSDATGNTIIDSVSFEKQRGDIAFGRYPDGNYRWVHHATATPASANSAPEKSIPHPPVFSMPAGFYSGPILLSIYNNCDECTILYSVDGSDPFDADSNNYTEPLVLNQTTVLRAQAINHEGTGSSITTRTYFVNNNTTLPAVSLVTNPPNLYDNDSGIYVKGDNASEEPPYYGANYHQDWMKNASFEFISANRSTYLKNDVLIRISGNWSRYYNKKSFMVETDNSDGQTYITHNFFPDKNIGRFQKVLLRADAAGGLHIKNELIYRLNREAGSHVAAQSYLPVNLYLNGEYWGIYNLMESKGKEFIRSNYGSGDVDIISENNIVVAGDITEYNNLLYLLNNYPLHNPAAFSVIDSIIDIYSCVDYWFYEIFTGKHDNGNIRFWKFRRPEAKWHWTSYDMDSWSATKNNVARLTENTYAFTYLILGALLKNSTFKTFFINRCADLLNTVFTPDNVKHHIAEINQHIAPDLPREQERWKYLRKWGNIISDMIYFADTRPDRIRDHIKSRFSIDKTVSVEVTSYDSTRGYVAINTINFPGAGTWKGTYFAGIPVTITAHPCKGFYFKGWTDNNVSDSATFTRSLNDNIHISPLFVKNGEIDPKLATEANTTPLPYCKVYPLNHHQDVGFSFPGNNVVLNIYSLDGCLVNTFFSAEKKGLPLQHIIWNRRNRSGIKVKAGCYLYKLVIQKSTSNNPVVLTGNVLLM